MLRSQNTIYITILFVCFHYTAGKILIAQYALKIEVKEVCIKVEILNNCEKVNESCYSRDTFQAG